MVWSTFSLYHGIRHEHDRYWTSCSTKNHGIASNALWPRTTIATAAVKNLLGGDSIVGK